MERSKYEVVKLLWSNSQARYIEPGEILLLDDESALPLLQSSRIKPARVRRVKSGELNAPVEKELNEDDPNN